MSSLPYQDVALSPDARTRDLLSRMSLAEKIAQMQCVWQDKTRTLLDAAGNFDEAVARAAFGHGHGLGQVGRPSDAGATPTTPERGKTARGQAELTNAIQRFFVTESRLGIPVVFHEECLHGQAAVGGTSFPQPIGLAGTFNPALVEQLYAMTAREARLRGTHQALTPVVDVARDPRWGRVEETFGEDPHLVSRMGVAAVRGFQGDATFRDKAHVMATLKHFVAHGQPEGGQNCAPVNVSLRELREVFLPPFKAAIQEAGAVSVMASYNEVDAVPSHANRWLLRDVLRDEWGFQGFVVSDYYAIWELHDRPDTHGHFVAADKRAACALAVRAGVNIEFPDPDCYRELESLVQEGALSEAELDALVAPMLQWKFAMGLFDDPYVDPVVADSGVGSDAHVALARQAARETITLLKNDRQLLPLSLDRLQRIAVVGPNADVPLLGGYSGVPSHSVSILEGIRARAGAQATVHYAQGCYITRSHGWSADEVVLPTAAEDAALIAEAVATVSDADVIVLALGENEQTSREAWSRVHLGDRTSLELFGRQNDLVRAMLATGKPVIAILVNGRPLAASAVIEELPAVLECWWLGQEGGHAVAEVLFGDVSPGGKLPISIPRSAGHLPVFYNHKPSARRGYLAADTTARFPFGFGMSYTSFALGRATIADEQIRRDGHTSVEVRVTNTGACTGSEVVQLYIRDDVSSVTRPVKELKGFAKVSLTPGESAVVSLAITPESLAFHDDRMAFVVEPGTFTIWIGTSSRDEDCQRLTLRVIA